MKFDELQAFVAAEDLGSLSAAAERLHLTQPAVSKRIQALEKSLDVQLFDRLGQRLRLTEAGEVLLPKARELLAAREDATRALDDLAAGVAGRLRLATSHHIGLHRLAPVLKAFVRAYPDVSLGIRFEDSEAAHDLVAGHACDLAVVTLAPTSTKPGQQHPASPLQMNPVWRDPLVFVAAEEHPLASERQVSLAQLAEHPAVLPGLATYTGRIVADLFGRQQLTLRQSMSTNYLETIGMLVATGLGWSVLPETLLGEGLVRLNVASPPLERTLGTVRLSDRTVSRASAAFLSVLDDFAEP